jgi:hypothetical protein
MIPTLFGLFPVLYHVTGQVLDGYRAEMTNPISNYFPFGVKMPSLNSSLIFMWNLPQINGCCAEQQPFFY